jgi:D-beta-D-heptose 7-phosphate kinase/D-beta-D-heptose 1-phosphate adenosyltransferase
MITDKIIDIDFLKKERSNWENLVVTNGCFDLVHAGHVSYLSEAKKLGDKLLIGLNSDESVSMLKNTTDNWGAPTRPIIGQRDRALVLAAFSFVDYVCIFNEERATSFLSQAKPNVYVKAGDYNLDTIDQSEKCTLDVYGSEIVFLPFKGGLSTSMIIDKIIAGSQASMPNALSAAKSEIHLM